jgi:alkanesulfonate monooxygenase SsuD/methylene tetrahydromethanopterin reductase-like flavin-dependent oxidoreductase (luciferase family)
MSLLSEKGVGMEISITVEGAGLAWPRSKALIAELEAYGFAGIFKSDHFVMPAGPAVDNLETIAALTYLASHASRVHFGTLVSPVSFRDPAMLARQAMALDDLSEGRMILGVGAGWLEREHTMFGYELGTITQRFDRLEEGLQVITQLIRNDQPITFSGEYFQLQEAILMPRPQRATPIMVGGNGPKRTLPLVARFADIWSCQVASVELFAERSALLDDLLRAAGRQPGDVKRTVMVPVLCWQKDNEREQILRDFTPELLDLFGGADGTLAFLRDSMSGILDAPGRVVERMRQYEQAGVDEFIIQSFGGIKGSTEFDVLAEHILPHFS